MKITVAIPCYNLENRIGACLESVIKQDYPDVEILVIDDGSEDRSVEVVNVIISKHPERDFRFIINDKNLGLNIVRNIAIRKASGDCLFFIDGDDTIEPGTLTLFHQKMEETGAEVICGSFRKTDSEGKTILEKVLPKFNGVDDYVLASYIETFVDPQKGLFPITVWNKLYKLDFLKNHHIYCSEKHKFYEDQFFTFQVALNARSVAVLDTITYNYVQLPGSICHQKKGMMHTNNIYASLESVFAAYYYFKVSHVNETIPHGIVFLLNTICLTEGALYKFLSSEVSKSEKQRFLKWLKRQYRQNNINWNDVTGFYNRVSYSLLFSPFPYPLFQCYFRHLSSIVKVVKAFS